MTCSTERRRRYGLRTLLTVSMVAFSVGGVAPTVHAGSPEMQRLYEEGKDALDRGEPAVALKRFKAALRRVGSDQGDAWQMMLAIAVAYRGMDQVGHAIEYYRRFLVRSEAHQAVLTQKWLNRRERVKVDIGDLETEASRTHCFVSVTTKPEGAEVFIDDLRAGADGDALAPHGAFLAPGRHVIRAEFAGYTAASATVEAAAGKIMPLTLSLEKIAAEVPPTPPSETPASVATPAAATTVAVTHTAESSDSDLGGWILIGSASAVAVAGIVVNALSEASNGELIRLSTPKADWSAEDYTTAGQDWGPLEQERDTLRLVSGLLYGLAGAAMTGGILWITLSGDQSTPPSEARAVPTVRLSPTPDGLFGHASWRF